MYVASLRDWEGLVGSYLIVKPNSAEHEIYRAHKC